ncbi:glutamate ABC transporter substrate-binding protein [Actinoplanes sp. NPDC049681]|uniref:glutamate ABC transporter substrate-binding protein n=1 Tax=Actinoplanes sp. NPDC049681 TaxID=3363905 RepID=UPI0037A6E449
MRTRAAVAAVAVLTILGATGCSDDAASPSRPAAAASTEASAPAGPGTAPDTSCKPRASLRPSGPLPKPGNMPAGSYMRTIQDRGRLVLGTSQDTLLFSSRNPFTGHIEGFDVDMGRQIAQAIFGDPDKIQIKVVGYDQRVGSVDLPDPAARVDIVADTMTANCERLKHVRFSTIYYEAGQKVLVSSTSGVHGIGDLGGKKVCAAKGSTSYDAIAAATSKPVAVTRPSFGDCLVAFQQNEVDAISTDDTILVGLAAQDPYARIVGDPMSAEPYGMAMSQKHPEFTRFVNAVLAKNRANGTWKRTYERWLGDLGPAPKPPVAEYRD